VLFWFRPWYNWKSCNVVHVLSFRIFHCFDYNISKYFDHVSYVLGSYFVICLSYIWDLLTSRGVQRMKNTIVTAMIKIITWASMNPETRFASRRIPPVIGSQHIRHMVKIFANIVIKTMKNPKTEYMYDITRFPVVSRTKSK
jgi:hypothetical protein